MSNSAVVRALSHCINFYLNSPVFNKDATLIENDPLLYNEAFTCVGNHEQLREGGNI